MFLATYQSHDLDKDTLLDLSSICAKDLAKIMQHKEHKEFLTL